MKKLLLVALILMLPGAVAFASPYLVCDPQATVTHYKISGDTYWAGNVAAQADGSIRSDLATIPVGTHNISIVACRTSSGWPEVCSSPAPFSFTRPSAPSVPAGINLAP